MLWTTNSTSLLAKTVAKENINARHADLWEWGTFSEEVYVVNFPTSWIFIPYFVSFMDSFSFFFRFQARVALYTGGKEDLSIVFNSTSSHNVNWFSETRVTDSPWLSLDRSQYWTTSSLLYQRLLYYKRLIYRQQPWRLFWRYRMARHSFYKL